MAPSSSSPETLPIISIAPYLPATAAQHSDADRAAVAKALHEACRDIGFFYLNIAPLVKQEEMTAELELAREFFHRPQAEKDEILLTKGDGARGYQRLHQNVTQGKADHHEGLDMYAPSPYPATPENAKRPLGGENQYPINPPGFKRTLIERVDTMKVLGEAVMHGMCDGLDMTEQEWKDMWAINDNSFWSMRVIGYPALRDGQDGISCGEHKDYGCLTFLHADACPGSLQVLGKSGNWLNADMVPGCVVVNIGAMWERWTGGLYPATLHRVIHRSPTFRVSIPFFFEPNFAAEIGLLPAAQRKAKAEGREVVVPEDKMTYGNYLIGKVSSNFNYGEA